MREISKYKINDYQSRLHEVYRCYRTLEEEAEVFLDELRGTGSPVLDRLIITQDQIEVSGGISDMVIFRACLALFGTPPEGDIIEKGGKKIVCL